MAGGTAQTRSRAGARIGKESLIALACVALVAALAAVILRSERKDPHNPAAEAESVSQFLRSRIGPPETRTRQAAPIESTDVAGRSPGALRLLPRRNLFAPAPREIIRGDPAGIRVKTAARWPALSGVFIDGGSKQAMIGGKVVGEGESVGGYRLTEIGADYVVLESNGVRHRIALGSTQ